jgi:hypothetical protein
MVLDHVRMGRNRQRCVTPRWTVTLDDDRSATLILRVWLEGGTDGFRGRVTTVDTSVRHGGGELTVGVAASPGELVDAVRAWLDEFLGSSQPADGGT